MNPHFAAYVQLGRNLAATRGVAWEIPLDQSGTAIKGWEWDLTALAGDVPPRQRLRHFNSDQSAVDALNSTILDEPLTCRTLPLSWQDLIKAVAMEQLFVRRNSVGHLANNVIRPLRVLATCAGEKEPWRLTVDDVSLAVRVGRSIQSSGKLGDLVAGLVKVLFDANHLADAGPLYPSLSLSRLQPRATRRSKFLNSQAEIRSNLEDRKRSERLPERRAFWELVRIIMTEEPRTFIDELRFAAIRIMMLTGFRIGEAVLLPLDWRAERHYYDAKGRPADELGGYSRSLMIRHFAEKQQADNADSKVLVERTHYVPKMFEEVIGRTFDRIVGLTAPLRNTLRLQSETGRILPWFREDDLVPAVHIYTHLSGNPFWLKFDDQERDALISSCRQSYSAEAFDGLHSLQLERKSRFTMGISNAAGVQLRRMTGAVGDSAHAITLRDATGAALIGRNRSDLSDGYFRISEVESYVRSATTSKISDTANFQLTCPL